MSVRNDAQRATKALKQELQFDMLPDRVFVPWPLAAELRLAREEHFLKNGRPKVAYQALQHADVTVVQHGIEVSRAGYRLAVNAAPRYVRRRLLRNLG